MKLVYILTGTSRGLGEALVESILSKINNSIVLSVGRSISEGQARLLNTGSERFYFVKADLTDASTITQKLNSEFRLLAAADRIIFLSNAGVVTPIGQIGSLSETEIFQSVSINSMAPVAICNYLMKNCGDKEMDFVNITTGAAVKAIEGWAAYCSTKAFTRMFFDVLEKQATKNSKIRVYNIDPGVVDTAMQEKIRNADSIGFPRHADFIAFKNENKLQTPQDAAEKILEAIK